MSYVIDKDVPVPEKRSTNQVFKKIAAAMEEGDSVLLPTQREAAALVTQLRNHEGYTGTMRKQDDNSFRVWKIEESK